MKRDQLDYVQFDCDFMSKPKIAAIRFKYGAEGLLSYMTVLFAIGRATDAEISVDAFHGTMMTCGYSAAKSKDMFEYFILSGVLHLTEGGNITNKRIAEDQENVRKKRDEWKVRQSKSRDNRVTLPEKERDKSPLHGVTLNTEDLNTEDLNLGKGCGENPLQVDPLAWIDKIPIAKQVPEAETREAFRRWAQFCRKNGRNFDEIQAEAMMLNGAFLRERFPEAVNQAASNGWKNVRFDALPDKTAGPPKRKLTPTERTLEAFKNISKARENGTKLNLLE